MARYKALFFYPEEKRIENEDGEEVTLEEAKKLFYRKTGFMDHNYWLSQLQNNNWDLESTYRDYEEKLQLLQDERLRDWRDELFRLACIVISEGTGPYGLARKIVAQVIGCEIHEADAVASGYIQAGHSACWEYFGIASREHPSRQATE